MSKGKGPTDKSVLFLKEQEKRSNHNFRIAETVAARPRYAASLTLRIVTVLAVVVAIAIGEGVFGARMVAAQDQTASAPESSGAAQVSSPQASQEEAPPAAAPAPASHPRASSRSSLNEHLSNDLSDYLHQHHLPFVDAMVFSNAAGRPTSVKLSGQVKTEHGKEDAAIKSSDFLNEPGVRVENHIEVDAGLASTAPAPSSAAAAPPQMADAAAAAPADPCTDLCLKDEGHCNTACQTQAAGGATSGGFSVQAVLGQFGQSATALKQCNDQCVQTREHCTYSCSQTGSSAPPSEGADSGAPPPNVSDHGSEGPDTPPE